MESKYLGKSIILSHWLGFLFVGIVFFIVGVFTAPQPKFHQVEYMCADPMLNAPHWKQLHGKIWNCADYPEDQSWDRWTMQDIYELQK